MSSPTSFMLIALLLVSSSNSALAFEVKQAKGLPANNNSLIDFDKFITDAQQVQKYRQARLVTEQQFLKMAAEKGTIVLDTRSAANFKRRHIQGAVHLNFSDITKQTLAKTIPEKSTRVLIYCNNNFQNNPEAFPAKSVGAALNIPTFINLYQYGYRNLYELGPAVDIENTKIPLAGEIEMAKPIRRKAFKPVVPTAGVTTRKPFDGDPSTWRSKGQ